jgi:hypothetical protein
MKLYKLGRVEAKSKIQKRLLGTEIGLRVFSYYISLFIFNKESKKRGKIVSIEFQRDRYITTMITRLKGGRINVIAYINIYKVI